MIEKINYTQGTILPYLKEAEIGVSPMLPMVFIAILWPACVYGIWHVYNRFSQRMLHWVGSVMLSAPSYPYLAQYMTFHERMLAICGLSLYAVGAVIFGKRLFNPIPHIFGYHEIFHMCTLLSGTAAFYLLFSLAQSPEERCRNSSESILSASFLRNLLPQKGLDFCSSTDNSIYSYNGTASAEPTQNDHSLR